MHSPLFRTDKYKEIEKRTLELLKSQKDFLSGRTANSPRASGDAIQAILSERFESVVGDISAEYSASFARRAMADLAFTDKDGFYKEVDTIVKDNGKIDCTGEITKPGQAVTNYLQFHPSGDMFLMCVERSLDRCIGPFVRVKGSSI